MLVMLGCVMDGKACIYRWHCEEHDHELLFSEDRVADEGVGEAGQASFPLLEE